MAEVPKWTKFPNYPVTAGSMVLALGVTLAWWAKVDISPLVADAHIRRGELWRLVTDIFPHLDFLHLAFNLYWTWIFGSLLERVFGHVKTAALFLLFAVGASALDFALDRGGVGLSGVGYGLFGLLWMLSRRDDRFRNAIDQRTVVLFLAWFGFCILTTVTHTLPVANVAHGGGLILGVLVGIAISVPEQRILAAAGAAAVLGFSLWGATLGRPLVNLSGKGGYEEGEWGYYALLANRNEEATRWFRDAATYQPRDAAFWFDLGIAYRRLGNRSAAAAAFERAHALEPLNADYEFTPDEKQ